MTPYMEIKLMAEAAESNRLEVQSKLDRVTAERDAALGREAALIYQLDDCIRLSSNRELARKNSDLLVEALQQRLTAADERADHNARVSAIAVEDVLLLQKRADVLEGLLRRVVDSSVLSFEQDAPEELESLEADICAALKPAEATHDFRMIGTEKIPPMEYDEP